MNDIDFLIFPALVLDFFDTIDYVENKGYLEVSTKLGIKTKSLIGCKICDSAGRIYEVSALEDFGRINPFWTFEYFNPMHSIKLHLKEVSINFEIVKTSVLKILDNEESVWQEDHLVYNLISEVRKSSSQKELINCFMAIR